MEPIVALTIAGSDSGGGAGIQADIRTFSAFEIHSTSAITAVTAQNTLGVGAVHYIDSTNVVAQIEAVLTDFTVRAVKTGMLGQPSTVHAVADLAREGRLAPLVVDPVLVSTTGYSLMSDGGVEAYREALIPYATVLTPNLREAAILCDIDVRDVTTLEDMVELGRQLQRRGASYVLVKGGHFAGAAAVSMRAPDVLVGAGDVIVFDATRIDTDNDHGTGCTLSSAIAAGLAYGRSVPDSTRDAKSFVLAALTSATTWRLGHGRGPIDQFGWNA